MSPFPTKEELKADRDYLIDWYKEQGLPMDILIEAIEETNLFYQQQMKECGYEMPKRALTTADMECTMFHHLRDKRTYFCLEVQMPIVGLRPKKERVDLLTYDRDKQEWKCYELKLTKRDFKSKNSHSFHGHLNYFVVPENLYPEIKDDIPEGVGCYIVNDGKDARCVKRAKRRDLTFTHQEMTEVLLTALNRETDEYYFKNL